MKLIAQTTIVHDGKTYAPGETLDVKKAADADRLIALGAAAQPTAESDQAAADEPPPAP